MVLAKKGDWENDPTLFFRLSVGLTDPEIIRTNGKDPKKAMILKYNDLALPVFSTPFQKDYEFLAKDNSATPGGWSKDSYNDLLAYIYPRNYIVNRDGIVLEERNIQPGGFINSATEFEYVATLNMEVYGFPRSNTGDTKQGGTEPWMNTFTPGNHWVDADRLRPNRWTRSQPLYITRSPTSFTADNTTNVHHSYFSRPTTNGTLAYPLKIVVLEDLGTTRGKALFDPNVWGWYNNTGTSYVARQTR